jgi:hypothetical protein
MSVPSLSRVVVLVTPRMFGDALSVALAHHDLEVTVLPPETPPATPEHYDVAVISSSQLPPDFAADVVICLRGPTESGGLGSVADVGGRVEVAIRDLSDVVDLIHRATAG